MQHDARFLPSGNITIYDNHSGPGSLGPARGVEYSLDVTARQATFVSQLLGTAPSGHQGSFRRYPDGASVIGWGAVAESPAITEYDSLGRVVLEIAMPDEISYRAIKIPTAQLDIALMRAGAAK
jgi:hypothetical protein